MNDEIIYNILLNSNIHDIRNLCQSNIQFKNICHDKHFWIDKFNHDNLIYIENDNFIDDYITAVAYKLITFIKNKNDLFQDLYINIPSSILKKIDDDIYLWILNIIRRFVKGDNIPIKITYSTLNNLWFIVVHGNTKIIDENLVIKYLKSMIYINSIIYLNKVKYHV